MQDRVQFESDAVLAIISRCLTGNWELVSSEAIDLELSKLQNRDKIEKVLKLYSVAESRLVLCDRSIRRVEELQLQGIKLYDSLHLALAEVSGVDALLTTDDAFLRMAKKLVSGIVVNNPVDWLMEVLRSER
ncbi:MAG: PIN domain-containing protein [Symbiobacteriaceae bacterium]|nr:PIN domain-containing protein [Symbiobacteriaceae bacterium]